MCSLDSWVSMAPSTVDRGAMQVSNRKEEEGNMIPSSERHWHAVDLLETPGERPGLPADLSDGDVDADGEAGDAPLISSVSIRTDLIWFATVFLLTFTAVQISVRISG